MIKYQCECGNEDQDAFDIYVSQGELCDILTVVCKNCGNIREELVASYKDSICFEMF